MLDVTTDTLSMLTYLFHKSESQNDKLLEMCPGAAAQIAPDECDSVRRSNYSIKACQQYRKQVPTKSGIDFGSSPRVNLLKPVKLKLIQKINRQKLSNKLYMLAFIMNSEKRHFMRKLKKLTKSVNYELLYGAF